MYLPLLLPALVPFALGLPKLATLGYIPHGHCYLWKPELVGLHVISDGAIALAYASIPLTLLYFVRKRSDVPFGWLFLLFSAFIICCGATHAMGIWTLWHPDYWVSGGIKALTAIVSIVTAIAIVPIVPKALALPSPAALEASNAALRHEIEERQQVECALRESEQRLKVQNAVLEETLQELRRAQLQLIQNEKMSSLGETVAGIAHEINNPINFIHGNLVHAQEYVQQLFELIRLYGQNESSPSPAVVACIDEIDLPYLHDDFPRLLGSMQEGSRRIRDIVRSLRNFSRLDESERKCVDIHDGLNSTLTILQHRFKATSLRPPIQLVTRYGDLPKIECYPGQLNQVLTNLLANAIDAIDDRPSQTHPEIAIVTETVGDGVRVRIRDNGCGMPADVRQKLFDPFFTTKPIGKGTGLGLSISYQIIVEQHGGRLTCTSQLGRGTEFVLEVGRTLPPDPTNRTTDDITDDITEDLLTQQ